jgi:predicted metal-binding membrane protein
MRGRTVLGGLAVVVALCWAWIIAMALDMRGGMTGPAAWMMTARWDRPYLALLFAMWSAMMVAMMLPSLVPALLQFPSAAFAAGYVFAWTLFSLAATIAFAAISKAQLLTPMMEPATPAFASALLLSAGGYQLLPFKRRCLSSSRSPTAFTTEAFRTGTRHGLSCLASCWVLMLLLFAGGVMNLTVIAALTLLVLFEKIAPFGVRSTVVTGGGLIGVGLWVLAR